MSELQQNDMASLAKTIEAAFKGLARKSIETYLETGDKIIAASVTTGMKIHTLCTLLVRQGVTVVGRDTLLTAVRLAKGYTLPSQRKTLVETAAPIHRADDLASGNYTPEQRARKLADIKGGRSSWQTIQQPSEVLKAARLEATAGATLDQLKSIKKQIERPRTKAVNEESREDLLREVTIRWSDDGKMINDEALENGLMALRSRIGAAKLRTMVDKVCKLGGKE
jgi:hypothetical protein